MSAPLFALCVLLALALLARGVTAHRRRRLARYQADRAAWAGGVLAAMLAARARGEL